MKKLPLVLLSIALILFAFSSCSNSTGTPAPSQEDIDAVKNGINVETILKDAFSGKDGIDVKYEYPQAKAAEEASIKAIATFNGYTSGSLKITAGSIEFEFTGTTDGTSFSATTYSAKTTARLEVSSGNGNPVPVSIDIPESANATAEVKATITDGVLSTTSVQVTINNLPESSTATITIADEEATAVTGSGNEAGGGASGGGGGGTVTPPGEEENPGTGEGGDDPVTPPDEENPDETSGVPIPTFIEASLDGTTARNMLSKSTAEGPEEAPQEGIMLMYNMVLPAITGFSGNTSESSIDKTIFGQEINLTISKNEDGKIIYKGTANDLAVEIIYDIDNQTFDYNQIIRFKNFHVGDDGLGNEVYMDYYAITKGSKIKNQDNVLDGETSTYVLFTSSNNAALGGTEDQTTCSHMQALFHSDTNIIGYISYKAIKPEQIEKVKYEEYVATIDINNIETIIQELSYLAARLEPMYQSVYYNKENGTFGTDFSNNWSKADLLTAIEKKPIYENWNLAEILADDSLYPEVTPPDQTE